MRTWMEQSCGSQEQCKPHLVGVRDSYQVRAGHPFSARPVGTSWMAMPKAHLGPSWCSALQHATVRGHAS